MPPLPVLVLLGTYALGWHVLNYTRFGRHTYALGDSVEAARRMGLNVGRVTAGVYTLSGALAGLAGVLLASRLGTGKPVAAVGREPDAIAAVVVGGTLLTGGQGGRARRWSACSCSRSSSTSSTSKAGSAPGGSSCCAAPSRSPSSSCRAG